MKIASILALAGFFCLVCAVFVTAEEAKGQQGGQAQPQSGQGQSQGGRPASPPGGKQGKQEDEEEDEDEDEEEDEHKAGHPGQAGQNAAPGKKSAFDDRSLSKTLVSGHRNRRCAQSTTTAAP